MVLGLLVCCMAALLPAVMLYFPNMADIPFADMLPYFGIMIGLAVLAWAGMYLITRRKGLSAVAAAVWLLVLLNVGRLFPSLHAVFPRVGLKVIAPVTLVLLIAATFGLSRLKEEFLYDAAKVAAFALAAFILSTAVPALLSGTQTDSTSAAPVNTDIDLTPAQGRDRPNIYWIIPDEYAGYNELLKYYHHDNAPFYASLREMGFTASENSYNWIANTMQVLRDILNLRYVSDQEGDRKEMVGDPDAPLWSLLRNLGYEICEVETTDKFHLTDRLKAWTRGNMPETEDGETVANLLLRYSILYRYENDILRVLLPNLSGHTGRDSIRVIFDWALDADNLKSGQPSCTVIYNQCPHRPYIFDRDGNAVPGEHHRDIEDKRYYLDQLIFATSQLENMCRSIVENDPDSIIILQSDHGMRSVANITYLDETNILNAVYFRGEEIGEIDGKNGLNTWIAVLRKQFGLDITDVEEIRRENEYIKKRYDPAVEDPNDGLIPKPKK